MPQSRKPAPAVLAGAVVVAVVIALGVGWLVTSRDSSDQADEPAYTPSTTQASPSETQESTPTPAPRTVQPKPAAKGRPITSRVPLEDGATAVVTKVESVRSRAELPGEVAAPAVRLTVKATGGDEAIDLSKVVVNAYYGPDRTPAISMTEPGGKPFEGTLAAGRSANGVFVFNVPPAERDQVFVEFSWSPKAKPVVLTADLS